MEKPNLIRLFVFGIVFILFGCSEYLFDEQIEQKSIIGRKISMNDVQFKSNARLTKSVADLKELKLNSSGRYEYNEVYDFFIDEENGVYLEKDSLESYTFPVYKSETDSTVTNVIFNKSETGEFDVIIAKYDILIDELPTMTESQINQSNVEYTDLTGRTQMPQLLCVDIQEYQYSLVYTPGEGYSYQGAWYTTGSYCSWGSSSGGNSNTGSGPGGTVTVGGGGTSGTSTGGIITTPVGNHGRDLPMLNEIDDSPCGRLKRTTSNTIYKQKFKDLNKDANFNRPYETGFGEKIINGVRQYVDATVSGNSSMIIPNGSVSYTHVHNNHLKLDVDGNVYDAGIKILSPADLVQLLTTCSQSAVASGISPLDSNAIMISNEGIFALTILDTNINLSAINPSWANFEKEYFKRSSKILLNPNLTVIERKKALQKMLLGLLKDLGLENKIGLFEGVVQPVGTDYYLKWTRKKLNVGVLEETPC